MFIVKECTKESSGTASGMNDRDGKPIAFASGKFTPVGQIDEGLDPREVKAATEAAAVAKREDDKRASATVAEAWAAYLADRAPHWGERHMQDHLIKADLGGRPGRRGLTKPGPLACTGALR